MKTFLIVLLLITTNFVSCKSQELKVMTYNIRLDIKSDGENAWPNRSNFLTSQVLFLRPDILGVQEARPNQMKDLSDALADYKFIGEGRDGDGKGEYSAIFYNSKKIKVENVNTFWLSETPEIVSKGWDAAYPRICTYGLFTVLESDRKIWFFNTHLDHIGAEAQNEGMKLILEKIKKVNVSDFPVILTGDFNVVPNSELMTNLTKDMTDSKDVAKIQFGPYGTFNGFKYDEPITNRIDYVMVSKSSKITIDKYAVLSSSIDFKFPSDHFPVFVELTLK